MKKTPSNTSKSPEQLATSAHDFIKYGQFKEAINAYKELLKLKPDPETEQHLAAAYRGRATEIAAKGMYPEAIVLWENQARLVQQSPCTKEYVTWLFQAGLYAKLAGLADDISQALEADGKAKAVLETLAILALDDSKLLAQFPADHAIVKHHPILLKALFAYSSGKLDEVETCLQQIPSRSPYREVRTVLKALLLLQGNRAEGIALLSKISSDSVLWEVAQHLARHVTDKGVEVSTFQQLGGKLQTLITKLNGYDKYQLNLLRELKRIATIQSGRVTFEFALNNRKVFGDEAVKRFCYAMLIQYIDGAKLYERNFGKISRLEKLRLSALMDEHERYIDDAIRSWLDYLAELGEPSNPATLSDHDKQVRAIIYRHCYNLAGVEQKTGALAFLVKGLTLDPSDKASYIRLYQGYRESDRKKALEYLEQGLNLYPQDVELLTQAMNAAAERKAFKKAAGYARAILSVDSINSTARTFLIEAHLGHARKQIKSDRLDLAQQELDAGYTIDVHQRNASLHYLAGIIALKQNESAVGEAAIRRGFATEPSPLTAELGLAIELAQLDYLGKKQLKYPACLEKKYQPNRKDILSLAHFLRRFTAQNANDKYLHKALDHLKPVIRKGIAVEDMSVNDYFDICEQFLNIEEYDLLAKFSECFYTKHPSSGISIFFGLLSYCEGDLSKLTNRQMNKVMALKEQTESQNDTRTANLIDRFISKQMARVVSEYEGALPQDAEVFDEGIKEVRKNLKPEDMSQIMEAMESIRKLEKLSNKQLIDIVSSVHGKGVTRGLTRDGLLDIAVLIVLEQLDLSPQVMNALLGDNPA